MQHGELRSCRGSRLVNEFFLRFSSFNFNDTRGIVLHLPQARLLHQLRQHQATVGLEKEKIKVKLILLQCLCQVPMLMIERGNPLFAMKPITTNPKPTTNSKKKTNKKETMIERGSRCLPTPVEHRQVLKSWSGCKNSEKILWMIEFLNVETHSPVLLMNHLLEPTPTRSLDLGKHSVETHFPKDRNCEICQRTKITRAPCRRCTGEAVLEQKSFVT